MPRPQVGAGAHAAIGDVFGGGPVRGDGGWLAQAQFKVEVCNSEKSRRLVEVGGRMG